MEQNIKTTSFDFFKADKLKQKIIALHNLKEISVFLSKSVLALFIICAVTWIGAVFYQDTAKNIAQEKTESDMVEQKKIEFIQTLSDTQMNAIYASIKKHQNMEIKALIQSYWMLQYMNEIEGSLNMTMLNKKIKEQIFTVNNFYDSRLNEIVTAHNFIKAGKAKAMWPTHDGSNAFNKIITWNSIAAKGNTGNMDSTDALLTTNFSLLKYPAGWLTYQIKNKELMEKENIF